MCVCVGRAPHSLWDITQRNMKLASIFLKALKYYSSWPEMISLSFLLDEDISTAFINLCTSEGANIHFVEIIRVRMPRHDHRGKHGTQLTPCSRRFCSPFFTLWLLLRVLINSGAHAARMHFPGGEENIQGGKKQKEGKIITNPSFRFSVITLQRVCKSWLLMIWLAASETFRSEHHPYASDHQFVNQFIRQLNVP